VIACDNGDLMCRPGKRKKEELSFIRKKKEVNLPAMRRHPGGKKGGRAKSPLGSRRGDWCAAGEPQKKKDVCREIPYGRPLKPRGENPSISSRENPPKRKDGAEERRPLYNLSHALLFRGGEKSKRQYLLCKEEEEGPF